MKATIDQYGCIGCGLCVNACPEVFSMQDDGTATVHADPTSETHDIVREVAEDCPTAVIQVI